ncbi:unnamed protein product [Closterium sp. Naga37s-1]|nr:unnamed protein product [Closterium sp. Naga37s-1]
MFSSSRYPKRHPPSPSSPLASHSPLPALSGAAKLIVRGACRNSGLSGLPGGCYQLVAVPGGYCYISGGTLPIFTSPSSGPTGGMLTLVNLIFQESRGGIFLNVRTAINMTRCDFVDNTAPRFSAAVLSDTFPATVTPPSRFFTLCNFRNNTVAININWGNSQGSVPAMTFVNCVFRNNRVPWSMGGVISVAGTGNLRFKWCSFDGNSAASGGGAIFSSGASLYFQGVSFYNNRALNVSNMCGAGGAVYAYAGSSSPATLLFCSVAFSANVREKAVSVNGEEWARSWGGVLWSSGSRLAGLMILIAQLACFLRSSSLPKHPAFSSLSPSPTTLISPLFLPPQPPCFLLSLPFPTTLLSPLFLTSQPPCFLLSLPSPPTLISPLDLPMFPGFFLLSSLPTLPHSSSMQTCA